MAAIAVNQARAFPPGAHSPVLHPMQICMQQESAPRGTCCSTQEMLQIHLLERPGCCGGGMQQLIGGASFHQGVEKKKYSVRERWQGWRRRQPQQQGDADKRVKQTTLQEQ
jgi:hypothetical protein